jgi:hypothetical protein
MRGIELLPSLPEIKATDSKKNANLRVLQVKKTTKQFGAKEFVIPSGRPLGRMEESETRFYYL